MNNLTFSLKSITDYSIFGEYKNPEDRLTTALLQVMHHGGHELIAYLFSNILDLPSNEISIIPQSSQKNSRPDGEISCNCQYQIFIESKITPNSIREDQLQNHCKLANPSNGKYLVYITPDKVKPQKLACLGLVEWMNWSELYNLLCSYQYTITDELLRFLIQHLLLLIEHIVFNRKLKKVMQKGKETEENTIVIDPSDTVIIVGGRWGESVAKIYNFYACQPNRYFLPAKHMAFYWNHRIKYLFEIVNDPIEAVDIQTIPSIHKDYFTIKEPHYKPELRKFFQLKLVKEFKSEIINDTKDKNGNPCAFVQRQRYTTLNQILKAKYTSDL